MEKKGSIKRDRQTDRQTEKGVGGNERGKKIVGGREEEKEKRGENKDVEKIKKRK